MFLLTKKATLFGSALLFGMSLAGDTFAAPKRTNPTHEPVRTNPAPKVGGNGTFGTQFQQTCYQGFYKGPKVMQNSAMIDHYICYSDVIYCPPYFQKNDGRWANVHPIVIVKQIGGNPESGQAKRFQIQYKCDYSPNYKPEG
ncbi:hypothetical protein GUA87_06175 [Sneathiella sp. P13V-1]|uniref:hypothetical protein n=1 Tax=Sneathiella sp. P13V-1 TaxID=2697366 RepID=UPI00187B4D3F|nr:hypothetical protein [Sneathiella sp. P13V-1]MBE7636425.1 hypothetical protein [Sneathiella sp. P13V-1]